MLFFVRRLPSSMFFILLQGMTPLSFRRLRGVALFI